jgi:hypothetical protein
MEFYWNIVTEKSGLLKPSDITDCTVYARPLYARFTVYINYYQTEPICVFTEFVGIQVYVSLNILEIQAMLLAFFY